MTPTGIIANQQRTFARLWRALAPHVRTDRRLPARIEAALRRHEFGSRDRRLYRELLYTALRHLPWVDELAARTDAEVIRAVAWLAAETPATRAFRLALVGDWPPLPPTIAARARHLGVERDLLPAWFRPHCPAAFVSPNLEVLHTRAPLWIRVQADSPETVLAELAARGFAARPAAALPGAWEITGDADLTATAAWRAGRFEVQDLGSQLILAAAADIRPGGIWLDACAGAGGKTLQLAALVGPAGRIDAHDIRGAALAELARRADRAGFANIHPALRLPDDLAYDGVLVDAPCSGSGTWRRAPHLKWCTTAADIAAHAARQRRLLDRFAARVRPGGLLVYATCSLSREENEAAVAAFLAAAPGFAAVPPTRTVGLAAGPGRAILPAEHDTDGFFVATLRRAP
ncbi:MAG TPA: RsmB/NOP family class I SAM-dependent RNA methyltransferase [Opitutaceae bacterium]|nr:RsmB/NOP family class I SAM-dependent RNA methyltransferase [Opitutaceae bacterium]